MSIVDPDPLMVEAVEFFAAVDGGYITVKARSFQLAEGLLHKTMPKANWAIYRQTPKGAYFGTLDKYLGVAS
jgi:hypothetical protein